MATDGDGLKAHGLVAHHLAMVGERQVAAEQGCIDVAIDGGNIRMAVEYGIEGLHVVDGTLEGGPHGKDDKHRTAGVEFLLQLFWNHTSHGIAFDEFHVKVLQVGQAHV